MHEFRGRFTGPAVESGGIIWEVPVDFNIIASAFAPRRATGASDTGS
jgi:hypothetical protein